MFKTLLGFDPQIVEVAEFAIGMATYHDSLGLESAQDIVQRLLDLVVAYDAPVGTILGYGEPHPQLEGYGIASPTAEDISQLIVDGNVRELMAILYVLTDQDDGMSFFHYLACLASAKSGASCSTGMYKELVCSTPPCGAGRNPFKVSTPDALRGTKGAPGGSGAAIPLWQRPGGGASFRLCASDEICPQSGAMPNGRECEAGEPIGLCVTEACVDAGTCECKMLAGVDTSQRMKLKSIIGQAGVEFFVKKFREVCESITKQSRSAIAASQLKYGVFSPPRGWLRNARVGDKMKAAEGVHPADLAQMQTRMRREGAVDIKTSFSAPTLQDLGLGLSRREIEHQRLADSDGGHLDWNIGAKVWMPKFDNLLAATDGRLTERPGYGASRQELGMRILSSPSGTTDQAIMTAKLLGFGEEHLYGAKLASIGWMLFAQHHTYDEMCVVGRPYGLPYDQLDPFDFAKLTGSVKQGKRLLTSTYAALAQLKTLQEHGSALDMNDSLLKAIIGVNFEEVKAFVDEQCHSGEMRR
jgi:hypothetical protein